LCFWWVGDLEVMLVVHMVLLVAEALSFPIFLLLRSAIRYYALLSRHTLFHINQLYYHLIINQTHRTCSLVVRRSHITD
jgi:hypothetical protein